jgi:hypothetical protein
MAAVFRCCRWRRRFSRFRRFFSTSWLAAALPAKTLDTFKSLIFVICLHFPHVF